MKFINNYLNPKCILLDAAGQPLCGWDADERQFHSEYDALRRPVQKWGDGLLLESYIYGEGQPNDKDLNLRGQLYQVSDGAGQLTHVAYDFKGNVLETARQLLDDPTIGDADWARSPALSGEVFTAYATYDALSRLVDTKDPGGNIQEFSYDSGGYLKTVSLNGAAYVQDIHYDAKGHRQAIWYGNGTKTSYAYDAATFRIKRLLTVNLATNAVVQDLNYWYDPVGNITRISDDAQQTLFYANQLVSPEQDFTYDALYRLTEASGREQIADIWPAGMNDNWDDGAYKAPLGGDAAQRYTQYYTYDAVGNILELKHSAGVGSYTRTYGYGTSSNRLVSTEVGTSASSTVYTYGHDTRGNMKTMPHLTAGWGLQNQMSDALVGGVKTCYQYDGGGQRVRKYTDKGSVQEERIYLGSYEVYREYVGGVLELERTTVHVSDDTGRIAMLETRTQGTDPSPASLTRYIYSNHLQSAALELDDSGQVISYEEYHPYGTTAYQASNSSINAVAKRYRFSGKERDEESGLYYHGARYYAPWLGRWTAVDPLEAEYAPLSPYNYCFNNPVNFTDGSGMGPDDETWHAPLAKSPAPIATFDYLQGQVIYTLPEVDVTRSRPNPGSAVDNTAVWRMDPVQVQAVLVGMEQQHIYEREEVLMGDRWGNGYIGSRKAVTERIRTVERQHDDAVAANILGGFFGSLGYWIGGERGAAIGASVDQAMAAGVAIGSPIIQARIQRGISELEANGATQAVRITNRFPNEKVRAWYDLRVNTLNTKVEFTEENARALNQQRNALKIEARMMMADRELAARLDITDPVRPLEYYVKKYSAQGYSGQALWKRIIQGTVTPNQNVNQKLGINKTYYYGK